MYIILRMELKLSEPLNENKIELRKNLTIFFYFLALDLIIIIIIIQISGLPEGKCIILILLNNLLIFHK